MPPQPGVSITPQPSHKVFPSQGPVSDRHGFTILVLITATVLVVAFFQFWNAGVHGSVTLLVRTPDGIRTVETLSLPSGDREGRLDVDPASVTTRSTHTFTLTDGSQITTGNPGVVHVSADGNILGVLIASPVPPLARTPLAVWGDADLVAWVSPVDGSLQVFRKSSRGTYAPIFLSKELQANSLGFTEDGVGLVAGRFADSATDFYVITLGNDTIAQLPRVTGLASVIPTP